MICPFKPKFDCRASDVLIRESRCIACPNINHLMGSYPDDFTTCGGIATSELIYKEISDYSAPIPTAGYRAIDTHSENPLRIGMPQEVSDVL